MTPYRFRLLSAAALFLLLVFAVLAFGAVDTWALTIFEVGVFALAAVWAARMAWTSLRPAWNRFYLPLGAAVVWSAAQYVLGLSVNRYRTGAETLKWLALWLLFALACQVFTDRSIRKTFNLGLVWFGVALCAFGLTQYFTSPRMMYWSISLPAGKAFGPFVNGNHFTALLELIVPLALLLALRPSEQRFVYVVAWSLMLAAIVVCASRAGTVLVAVETVVILVVKGLALGRSKGSRQVRRIWLPAAGLAMAAILSFVVAGTRGMVERFQEEQPYQVRWSVVQATWQLFCSRPWTGYGAGTFDQVYPSAARFDVGLFFSHAHNDPVQFAMEWGVVGIGVLLWILWLLLSRKWPQEVWLGAVLPVLAVLAHSWFDFPLQIPAVTAAWLLTMAQVDAAARGRVPEATASKGRVPVAKHRSAEPARSAY